MNFFSVDGKLYEWMNRFCQLVFLNFLWFLCSLPIVTIGASTVALYHVTFQLLRDQDATIGKSFFHAFRENFRQATLVFLITCGLIFLLFSDFVICNRFFSHNTAGLLLVPLMIAAFLLCCAGCYLYPLIACFQNSIRKIFSNALRLAASHLLSTALLFILSFGPLLFLNIFSAQPVLGSFLCIILGVSLFAWLKSILLLKIFQPYFPET